MISFPAQRALALSPGLGCQVINANAWLTFSFHHRKNLFGSNLICDINVCCLAVCKHHFNNATI